MVARKRKAADDDWTPVAGSSTNPIVVDSLPPAKKQRKKKGPNVSAAEKRSRVCLQILMIDRNRVDNELKEEFKVLGYRQRFTVVIDKKPSCSCPDALKGNHCKHILFIFLKGRLYGFLSWNRSHGARPTVLQVAQTSGSWYQKALLTSELEDIFARAPLAPNAVAHPRIRDAYARATGKAVASSSAADSGKKRMPGPEDDCPICYENMHRVDEKTLTFCNECGNGLHKQCFQQWANTAKNNVTCVFCRAKWVMPATAGGSSSRMAEGYLNLAGIAGVSPVRDTSTYYHGRNKYYYD
ncbi:hypothetical protein A0H81_10892 [Grifola frondosa]|uniref:Mitogen-activated protein kinase kinase kinase 1 n=1 Tax=Grifola frondosa TaxID=5627 RepID=A0A1C7LYP1_GRIFR|nr:hypothetical protein A0H81_10892 [Grifola frondosa]